MMMEEKKEAIEENQDAAVVVVKEDEEEEDSKPKARRRLVVREEEDDMNECLAEIGFMMEGAMPTKLERFEWKASEKEEAPNQNQKPKQTVVRIALNHIDIDQPGAVQSGHYLWPGARLLADYLVQNYAHYNTCNNTKDDETVESVLELGAGCALASLVALQVWQRTIQCIVVTDHDLGVLERARDNYESTLDAHLNASSSDLELNQVINDMASIPFVFEKLEWGTTSTTTSNDSEDDALGRILDQLREHTNSKTDTFDVLLGSDLIYDATVVEPLLETVHKLLKPASGRFLLSQSFAWDDQAEAAFTVACARLGLQQQTVLQQQQQQDDDGGRIHEFRLFAPEATTTTTITDNNNNSGRPEEQASPEKDNTADAGGDEKSAANNTDKKSSS